MFVGTDPFSNCNACGSKVSYKLRKCPYCREPDPQLRNALDWRVNYTKNLAPSVTSFWKSTRPLRIRILKKLGALTFLATATTAFVVDYHPNLMTKYLGLRVNPSEKWLGALYDIIFVLLPISFTAALIPED